MIRTDYLSRVIRLYLDAPDTPEKARRNDWALAGSFYKRRIPLDTVAHAIRLATIRRLLREPDPPPLEPVHSLAYFRPLIDHLIRDPHDDGYVVYVAFRYRLLLRRAESAANQKRG